MATVTFLSASEASKYATLKPSPLHKPEVACSNEKYSYDDMCEFSFFEATPVTVSAIPEDIGLTMNDIFIDHSSSDEDIEILEEKVSFIAGLSATDAEHIQRADIGYDDNISNNIESYIAMTKDNPHVKISRGTFQQMINYKRPMRLEVKSNKITRLLDDVHRNINMQPRVIIKKIFVETNLPFHKAVNEYEVKAEPNSISFFEETVDDQFENTCQTLEEISFESSDDDTFEGFSISDHVTKRTSFDLRTVFKLFLQEQKDVISEEREFSLSSQLSKVDEHSDEVSILNVVKFCLNCRQTNNSNNAHCWNCKEKIGIGKFKYIMPSTKYNKYRCSECDYAVEDLKILGQHYIIHGKNSYKNIENPKEDKGNTIALNKRKVVKVSSRICRSKKSLRILGNLRQHKFDKLLQMDNNVPDISAKKPTVFKQDDIVRPTLESCRQNKQWEPFVNLKVLKPHIHKKCSYRIENLPNMQNK